MLDGVGDVRITPADARQLERAVEHASRGAHEGPAGEVFLISGLFANEHERCVAWPGAENGLRTALIELAAATAS
jgi:hypothetical protein